VGQRGPLAARRPAPLVTTARALALEALARIEDGGAYANLVVPELLRRSDLAERDRHFATELVYGTTRMRRACDLLVDRFLTRDIEPVVRRALRIGAYQLHFLAIPPHAAVGETVEVAPKRARGLVNAVLRRVADSEVTWPDDATRLSYPDWIVERLTVDLGGDAALTALEVMDRPPVITEREDGYVQDLASQWVAQAVDAQAGERILDVCAAPGGKALILAAAGAHVVAADIRASRAGLVAANARGRAVLSVLVADGTVPPLRPASFDRVLVDAPCSGLGVLRRRPDARWRIESDAVERLAGVQRALIGSALALVRPGGHVVYSVCTLTDAEGPALDRWLTEVHPGLEPVAPPPAPWEPVGRGARLLPQSADTDGMYLLHLRRPA
jgi:16S rRNA (cytosine967-C5)-methyltransferase